MNRNYLINENQCFLVFIKLFCAGSFIMLLKENQTVPLSFSSLCYTYSANITESSLVDFKTCITLLMCVSLFFAYEGKLNVVFVTLKKQLPETSCLICTASDKYEKAWLE